MLSSQLTFWSSWSPFLILCLNLILNSILFDLMYITRFICLWLRKWFSKLVAWVMVYLCVVQVSMQWKCHVIQLCFCMRVEWRSNERWRCWFFFSWLLSFVFLRRAVMGFIPSSWQKKCLIISCPEMPKYWLSCALHLWLVNHSHIQHTYTYTLWPWIKVVGARFKQWCNVENLHFMWS